MSHFYMLLTTFIPGQVCDALMRCVEVDGMIIFLHLAKIW